MNHPMDPFSFIYGMVTAFSECVSREALSPLKVGGCMIKPISKHSII